MSNNADLSDFDGSRPERTDSEIEEPLTITENGLELPERFRTASRLIIRVPTMTVDSYLGGENTRRKARFESVRPDDYDPDYLDGEGRAAEIRNDECLPSEGDDVYRVGILPAGGEQYWLRVDVQGGDGDE